MHHRHRVVVGEGKLHAGTGLDLEFGLVELHRRSHAERKLGVDFERRAVVDRGFLNFLDFRQQFLRHIGEGFLAEVVQEAGKAVTALEAFGFTVPAEVLKPLLVGPVVFQVSKFLGVVNLIALR